MSPVYTYRANTLIERLAITPDEERLIRQPILEACDTMLTLLPALDDEMGRAVSWTVTLVQTRPA